MDRSVYYASCFLALVVLESFPHFISDALRPYMIVEHAVLILVFLAVAWFFHFALHDEWRWSILSSMFFVEAIAAVALTVLLFLQLFSHWFVIGTALVLLIRAGVFSYLAVDRIKTLRSLVFFTCFVLLLAGELVMLFGTKLI
jgi:hypothetical protein